MLKRKMIITTADGKTYMAIYPTSEIGWLAISKKYPELKDAEIRSIRTENVIEE